MAEFVNETVSVETRLGKDGKPIPVAFAWRGRRFEIAAWGRQSTAQRDGRHCCCYLVQTAEMESWELCQDLEAGGWTLARRWPRELRAV